MGSDSSPEQVGTPVPTVYCLNERAMQPRMRASSRLAASFLHLHRRLKRVTDIARCENYRPMLGGLFAKKSRGPLVV